MERIQSSIAKIVLYGLQKNLIEADDAIYTANRLLELLKIDALDEEAEEEILDACDAIPAQNPDADAIAQSASDLEQTLGEICDYAYEQGMIGGNTVAYRDLFDTKVMALLTDRPSNIVKKFNALYQEDPKKATDYFYTFCQDCDYIRRYRLSRDRKWVTKTAYGDLDITINLSKPEKDPKAIAAARSAKASSYPKCQLCMENEGYAGRLDHPARGNHRIIPVTIAGKPWYFQYSPYGYYNEHCIVFNREHIPMKIERATFEKLLDFVRQFPHYFIGSNADLPIVGGSILSHDHFQGGRYDFAMAKAPIETPVSFAGYRDVEAGIVKWPMSVIRIRSTQTERLVDLADCILQAWRGYTDESAFIYAETEGEPHNTITPIARKKNGKYELDLVLRNNITTKEHPLGVFHPHAELHHIKKENIGLIEVMGLAVLPARLKDELEHLKEALLAGRDISKDEELSKHAAWAKELKQKYGTFSPDTIDRMLEEEVGLVFAQVLEQAGVYKRTPEGQEAFLRFVESVS